MARAPIVLDASVTHSVQSMREHVADAAKRKFSDGVRRPKNYAALLSQVWAMAESLITAVQLSDEPLPRKVSMLRDLTKLLPSLDKAESRHRVHIGKRAREDLTDEELETAVHMLLKRKTQQSRALADNRGVRDNVGG